jgi:acyl-coenzyme A synthetase/AMP-(fatty) acid ligase
MMMQNHPTFYITLLAISKIGAVPSLINTNLADNSLLHCIKIANTKLFLFDPIYESQVASILQACQELKVVLVSYGEATQEAELPALTFAPTLTPSVLSRFSEEDTSEDYLKGVVASDAAYLIYTRQVLQ